MRFSKPQTLKTSCKKQNKRNESQNNIPIKKIAVKRPREGERTKISKRKAKIINRRKIYRKEISKGKVFYFSLPHSSLVSNLLSSFQQE